MPDSKIRTSPGISFIHAADLRLDLATTGLRRLPSPVAAAVRDAPIQALDRLVELAIARDAAFVAIAGGIYGRRVPDVRSRHHVDQAMQRLGDAGIPVFMALGPDDPRGAWPGLNDLPPTVTVFPDDRAVTVFPGDRTATATIERDGHPAIVVHGRSLTKAADFTEAVASFRTERTPGAQVGILPVPAGPDSIDARASFSARFEHVNVDYWALGGIPERRVVAERNPWAAFPGSIQGRSTDVTELGPKGVLVVEVRAGVVQEPEFVVLDRIRLLRVEADAGAHKDLLALAGDLLARVTDDVGSSAGHDIVAQAVVRGEGPLAASFHSEGRADELLGQLQDLSAGREPFLWWDRVINETSPQFGRSTYASRGDLAAEVVAELDALATDDVGRSRLLAAPERAGSPEANAEWLKFDVRSEMQVLLDAEQMVLAALEERVS